MTPPNSGAAVAPTNTAPAARSREVWVVSWVPIRSLKTSDASVYGHPATSSSSLIPMGRPPKGSEVSAAAAVARAASASRWVKALSSEASMADSEASRASVGDTVPDRKASTREQASPCQG